MDRAIELSSRSEGSRSKANEGVAESIVVVEQVVTKDTGVAVEAGKIGGEITRLELPVDRIAKRPRVEAETSQQKSPPRIITDPSEHLQEVFVVFVLWLK